jgi:O-methyltransferase involved in polyketide biosynthesis
MDSITETDRPILVVAEGLLMYLKEEEVKDLFLKLRQKILKLFYRV